MRGVTLFCCLFLTAMIYGQGTEPTLDQGKMTELWGTTGKIGSSQLDQVNVPGNKQLVTQGDGYSFANAYARVGDVTWLGTPGVIAQSYVYTDDWESEHFNSDGGTDDTRNLKEGGEYEKNHVNVRWGKGPLHSAGFSGMQSFIDFIYVQPGGDAMEDAIDQDRQPANWPDHANPADPCAYWQNPKNQANIKIPLQWKFDSMTAPTGVDLSDRGIMYLFTVDVQAFVDFVSIDAPIAIQPDEPPETGELKVRSYVNSRMFLGELDAQGNGFPSSKYSALCGTPPGTAGFFDDYTPKITTNKPTITAKLESEPVPPLPSNINARTRLEGQSNDGAGTPDVRMFDLIEALKSGIGLIAERGDTNRLVVTCEADVNILLRHITDTSAPGTCPEGNWGYYRVRVVVTPGFQILDVADPGEDLIGMDSQIVQLFINNTGLYQCGQDVMW